jgi:hypothetical protein
MAKIKQRLQALEKKANGNLSTLVLFINDEVTDEQRQRIDDAESEGRQILLYSWKKVSGSFVEG